MRYRTRSMTDKCARPFASTRQDPPARAHSGGQSHYERVVDRLLVTKAEAAEQLSVSVWTVERLAAMGGCRRFTRSDRRSSRFEMSSYKWIA
jgi:hypothetical protein